MRVKKDYTQWHTLKDYIEEHSSGFFFNEREIWWCSLGANIGSEQDGKNHYFERPVLIFKKFSNGIFWGLPLTTKSKENEFYYPYSIDGQPSSILLSQIRLLSSKRLIRKLTKIHGNSFSEIQKEFISLIKILGTSSEESSGNLHQNLDP